MCLVAVDNYYPFGLTFNQQTREGTQDQRYGFQGQEHQKDLDLGWVQFKWRMHNPSIGRFFNVDPLASDYVYNSPYAFSENHVTGHVELEGLEKALPWYFGPNKYGKKPVLTLGLHNVKVPVVARRDYGDSKIRNGIVFLGNSVFSIYNAAATSFNEGMVGMEGAEAIGESAKGVEQLLEKATTGDISVEDVESAAALILIRKVKGVKGRSGKQSRLKELANDSKLGKADKGWIKQEMNSVKRKSKRVGRNGTLKPQKNIRNPPGRDLAHPYKQRAKDGYSYKNANLKNTADHIIEHKIHGYK